MRTLRVPAALRAIKNENFLLSFSIRDRIKKAGLDAGMREPRFFAVMRQINWDFRT